MMNPWFCPELFGRLGLILLDETLYNTRKNHILGQNRAI
jgi:hypothetical protein